MDCRGIKTYVRGVLPLCLALLVFLSLCLGAAAHAEDKWWQTEEITLNNAQAFWDMAGVFYAKGEYDQALMVLKRLAERIPLDYRIQKDMALNLAALNRHQEAIDIYQTIADRFPSQKELLKPTIGFQYLWLDEPRKAEKLFKERLAEDPEDKDALAGMALIALWSDKTDEAIKDFEALSRKNPDDPYVWSRLGHAQAAAGRRDKAIEAFTKALSLEPKLVSQIWIPMIDQYLSSGRSGDALALTEEKLKAQPDNRYFRAALAMIYLRTGKAEEAETIFSELKKAYANDAVLWEGLGYTYAAQDLHIESIEAFQRAMELQPANKKRLLEPLAYQYLWAEENQDALSAFQQCLAAAPDKLTCRTGEGLALIRLGKKDEGSGILAELTAKYPDNADFWEKLGLGYAMADMHPEAAEAFEKALTLDPAKGGEILMPLGYQYLWAERYDKAIETFNKRLEKDPADQKAAEGLALAYLLSDRTADAVKAYGDLTAKNPGQWLLWYRLGQSLGATDDHRGAIEAYVKARELKAQAQTTAPVPVSAGREGMTVKVSQMLESRLAGKSGKETQRELSEAQTRAGAEQPDLDLPLAYQYMWVGDNQEALKVFEERLAEDPNDQAAAEGRALALLWLGRPKDALAAYQALTEKYPGVALYWEKLATCQALADRHKEALASYRKALELDPGLKDKLLPQLANQYLWAEKPREAIPFYKEELAAHPDNLMAKENLALAYLLTNQSGQAQALYEELIKDNPDNADMWQRLAQSYAAQEKHDKAIKAYEKAILLKKSASGKGKDEGRNPAQVQMAQVMPPGQKSMESMKARKMEGKAGLLAPSRSDEAGEAFRRAAQAATGDLMVPLAYQFMWQEKYAKAVETFQKRLREDPADKAAAEGLALAYLWNGQVAQSRDMYEKLAHQHPGDAFLWEKLAQTRALGDMYLPAIEAYEKAISLDPARREKLLLPLGLQYLWSGNHQKALEYLEAYSQKRPGDAKAREFLAMAYLLDNKSTDAAKEYRKILENDPANAAMWHRLGQALAAEEDHAGAAAAFEKARELDPKLAALTNLPLAYQYLWQGMAWKSIPLFEAALEEKPGDMEVKRDLSLALFRSGQPLIAELNLYTVLDKRGDWAEGWELLGLILAAQDQHDAAAEAFLEAMDLDPKLREKLALSTAYQLLWADRQNEAIPFFRCHLAREPQDVTALMGLAMAYRYDQKYEDSREILRHTAYLAPFLPEPWIQTGLTYMDEDNYPDSKNSYAQALEIDPGNVDAEIWMGVISHWQGHFVTSQEYLNKALEKEPDNKKALINLALAQELWGRNDLAWETVDKGLKLYPQDPELAERKLSLEKQGGIVPHISGRYQEDSDNLKISTFNFTGTAAVGPKTWLWGLYQYRDFKQGTPDSYGNRDELDHMDSNRVGIGLRHRFDSPFLLNGSASYIDYSTGWNTWLADIDLGWLVTETDRIDIFYAREHFDPILAAQNELFVDYLGLAYDHWINWRNLFHVDYRHGWLQHNLDTEPESQNDRLRVRDMQLFYGTPALKLYAGPEFRWQHYSDPADIGIWNPENWYFLGLLARLEWLIKDNLWLEINAFPISWQKEDPGEESYSGEIQARLFWYITHRLTLDAELFYLTGDMAGGGYRTQGGQLGLSYRF